MYLLIDEQVQTILSVADIAKVPGGERVNIFPGADEKDRMFWWEGEDLPDHFEINAAGELVTLSTEKRVALGLLEIGPDEEVVNGEVMKIPLERLIADGKVVLKPGEQLVNNQIIPLPPQEKLDQGLITLRVPYEFITGEEIKHRTLEEILEDTSVITSLEEAQVVANDFYKLIERKLAESYSPGYELKLTKDYTLWIADGSPAGDQRQTRFEEMQTKIAEIKAGFADQKTKVRELVARFK